MYCSNPASAEVDTATSNKAILPTELARKVSPWIVNTGEMSGAVGKVALTVAMALSLYGPDHNGFLCFMGPWFCPALVAGFWTTLLAQRRFRIYRGRPFAEHRFVDTGDDPVVMRLAQLFNSHEAKRHLWREALKTSGILFAILLISAISVRGSLDWAYPSPANHFFWTARRGVPGYWFWPGLFGCSLFAFLALISEYYRWCLMTWTHRESALQSRKRGNQTCEISGND